MYCLYENESIIKISSQDYNRFEKKDDEPPIEKDEKTLGMAYRSSSRDLTNLHIETKY
jgi:TfoX/Sxy family transcriptional regulator of competence genes